ncbi:flavodoxin [Companilactobacillus bobalius]|uniref:Flavodoxin-like domain-containing protein n=2 Tax=Companilactobacillus bobalius TaxID=2801451 RepID=A0A202FFF5_9LACO|nr:flavodoxin [Companilactobacillus bobalius]KAE9560383.1 flavodoxin [Companilactobacillus bobalius]KRK83131.1 flavodoxin [Companilactobacillus bobalius DSM 19674]OVE99180.1 hypothetical protein LKACC16343_00292 [Companilactobacillus bobalius]GEO57156.1 flavodoxin [Companilactobacillus paralimentarius]
MITMGRGAVSDGKDTNENQAPTRILEGNKTIIIYFSRSGNTEKQVRLAQKILKTDVYELVITNPYPSDYQTTVNRATQERENHDWPTLEGKIPDLSKYDTILLGHPIWAMTLANPMRTFLEKYGSRLADKRLASFSTNAGYGSGDTQDLLHQLTPDSTIILNNYTVEDTHALQTEQRFIKWLKKIN